MKVHRLTVDAYVAQHPGVPERRSIQSIWVHLVGLYLTIERDLSPDFARRVIGALTGEAEGFEWLTPPGDLGAITVADAVRANDPEQHARLIRAWAQAVWTAWQPHHLAVATVADRTAARL